MVEKVKALSIGVGLLGLTCLPVLAADYANMSDDDLGGMRGIMQQRSQTERLSRGSGS